MMCESSCVFTVCACPVRRARLALRPLQLCWPSARLGWCGISRECRPVRVGMAAQSVSRPTQFHLLLHTHAQTRTPTQKLSNPISKSCPGPKPAFWPLTVSLTFHGTICNNSAIKMFYVSYWLVWLEISSTVFKFLSCSVKWEIIAFVPQKVNQTETLLWNQILEVFKEMLF